jgi:sugar phosphate isomerase/epimerase
MQSICLRNVFFGVLLQTNSGGALIGLQSGRQQAQDRGTDMTIVSLVTIHPNQGVAWDDVQKQLKKACDLARKHGAENVTVLATMIGGEATNTIGLLSTAEDWGAFGKSQQSLMTDPEMQAAMLEAGRIATWQTYVSQTIPDM